MEPFAPDTTYDRDLDPPRPLSTLRAADLPRQLPQEYQRLVANPFLALAMLIAWFAAIRMALEVRNLLLVGLATASVVLVVPLLQYHCLDCGATAVLWRWKSHACERVHVRLRTNRPRRFRGPNPAFQTLLWLYFVAIMAIFGAAWWLSVPG